MFRSISFLAIAAVATAASAELSFNQPIKINDTLSTEQALRAQPRISIRAIGVVEEDGEDVLRAIVDMPDSNLNNVTRTPGAAVGNEQIVCDVEDISPFTGNTRVFTCDVDALSRNMLNRVCFGYQEAFQFPSLTQDLTAFEANRCIDFLAL